MKKVVWFCLVLAGCPQKNSDCMIDYTIFGSIKDQSGNPVPGVEVHEVTAYGFDGAAVATTDTAGGYSYFVGAYSDLGEGYIYVSKAGFKRLRFPAIGKGTGVCGEQRIEYSGTLEPL